MKQCGNFFDLWHHSGIFAHRTITHWIFFLHGSFSIGSPKDGYLQKSVSSFWNSQMSPLKISLLFACLKLTQFLLLDGAVSFLLLLAIEQLCLIKRPLIWHINHQLKITVQKLLTNCWGIFPIPYRNEGKRGRSDFIHHISIYFQKCSSLLTVLGQVIPEGSESLFGAAGHRRCWAWNPITSAAMLALWHPAPSMQNATAAVNQEPASHSGCCWGVHPWVVPVMVGMRTDMGDTGPG